MRRPARLLIAFALLFAVFGTACSSSTPVATSTVDTASSSGQSTTSTTSTDPADAPSTQSSAASTSAAPALATTNVDYAAISGGATSTPTTPIPCHLSGPVADAFAASRGMELKQVSGNNCQWSEGRFNTLDIHFREIADIDVAERRAIHGNFDSTVVAQDGPGTDAAIYPREDGRSERYFFVSGSRAVFIVAEAQDPTTEAELRGLADEVAALIGSAVDEGQFWSYAGESGQDPLCGVWQDETIRQMFGADTVFLGASNGCTWSLAGPDSSAHEVTLDLDPFDSIEIYTRQGGSDLPIGDSAAVLEEDGIHGTLRQVAFAVGDAAFKVTVDSATHANMADALALNLADRLG